MLRTPITVDQDGDSFEMKGGEVLITPAEMTDVELRFFYKKGKAVLRGKRIEKSRRDDNRRVPDHIFDRVKKKALDIFRSLSDRQQRYYIRVSPPVAVSTSDKNNRDQATLF